MSAFADPIIIVSAFQIVKHYFKILPKSPDFPAQLRKNACFL